MENITSDIDIFEEDMMREVFKSLLDKTIRKGEATVTMVMKWVGSHHRPTYELMEEMVRNGILKKRLVNENGHLCGAYSPVDGKTWKDVLQEIRS